MIAVWWALWGVAASALVWQIRRALRHEAMQDQPVRAAGQHDVGPDALRLLTELDAHLDAYFARLSHLFEELGPPPSPDPMEAGRQRLMDAVRDNQNQHKGEQP